MKAIYAQAIEKTDPVERAEYLAGACGEDDALRETIGANAAGQAEAEETTAPTTPDAFGGRAARGASTRRRNGGLLVESTE